MPKTIIQIQRKVKLFFYEKNDSLLKEKIINESALEKITKDIELIYWEYQEDLGLEAGMF